MSEIGYLRRATEENTFQIRRFYTLLENHMKDEDDKVKALNKKVTVIGVLCLLSIYLPADQQSALVSKLLSFIF